MLVCFISHSILRVNLHFKAFKFEISLVQSSDCYSKKLIKPVTYSNALEFVILGSVSVSSNSSSLPLHSS